jgi:hypothetical protein
MPWHRSGPATHGTWPRGMQLDVVTDPGADAAQTGGRREGGEREMHEQARESHRAADGVRNDAYGMMPASGDSRGGARWRESFCIPSPPVPGSP